MSSRWGTQRTATTEWRTTRARVLARDHHTCRACAAPADTVDHIVAGADGGTDEDHNLQALCRPCHAHKTAVHAAQTKARKYDRRRPADPHPGILQ